MKYKYIIPENFSFSERKNRCQRLFLTIIFLLSIYAIKAQTIVPLNPGTTTWSVPAGVTAVDIQAWGGGGAGGGSNSNNNGGAGGGGGGYSSRNVVPVSGVIAVSIGVGGTGAVNANGTAGGNTTLASGIGMAANGGAGGPRNTGTGGLGGTASGGTTNTSGINGGNGGGNTGGNGGASPSGGAGGAGINNGNGNTGIAPGGGGGGGEYNGSNRAGGNGGNGRIVITYTLPTISGFAPTNGCVNPGTSVTITGTNFTAVTSVAFNGTAAVFTINSATSITATVPAAATTGTIRITNQYGFVNSLSTFTINPQPTVAAITGTPSVCPAGTTTLSNATPGGIWSSANTLIATVNSSGIVSGISAGTTTISYTVTSGCTTTVTRSVTVNSLPVLSGPSSVCIGNAVQFTTSNSGTWISNNTAVATIDNLGNVTTVAGGTTTFTFTDSVTGCSATTSPFNVNTPPAITMEPVLQSVCSGSIGSFSVTASGIGLTYQWFNGAISLSDSGNISGANSPILTLSPVLLTDASANYHCVVSGTCAPSATSANAPLIVTQQVIITSQPAVTQTFCSGNAASISVNASGAGLTYQWYNGSTLLANGGSISGATSATLTINPAVAADASANYYCIVSGTSPCNPVTSSNAIILINEIPLIVTQPIVTQTVCYGDAVSISVNASGGGLMYQWYNGATAMANNATISGADTSTITFNPSSVADSSANYHCVVSNACVTTADSDDSELIVNQKPVIPAQTAVACSETPFVSDPVDGVPTAATIIPLNTLYSWPAPVLTGGMTGGSAQSGQPLISETFINPTNIAQTATYTVTPTSGTSGNCIGNPFTLVVTVNPLPYINNLTPATCSGEPISISPSNGGGNIVPSGTTFSWGLPSVTGGIVGGTAQTGQATISQTLFNPTNAVQTATYNVTATSGSCVGSTFTVTITVNPKPNVSGAFATQPVCSGTAIVPIIITNPNNVPGLTSFSWSRDNTVNLTGMPSSGSGNTISGTLTNTTNVQQTAIFTLYATSEENCISSPSTVTVLVDPIPLAAASPSAQSFCSGSNITPITLSTSNGVAGATFAWVRDNTTNLTGIANNGTGTSISGSLTNTTATLQTTTFTVTATYNGCSSTNTFTITVSPQPTVAVSPGNQIVCGGTPFATINISNPNNLPGTTFSWTRNNTTNVTGVAASGTGNIILGTLDNITNINQTVSFTITATLSGCNSTTVVSDVFVMPTPIVTALPATQTFCNASAFSTINFGNTNNIPGTTYSWVRDNTTFLTGIAASGSGNSISGTLTNTTSSLQTTIFTVTANAPNGCSRITTSSITMYPQFIAPVISASQSACVLSTPAPLTMSPAYIGGSGIYNYQWQRSLTSTGPWTNVGTNSPSYSPPFVNIGAQNYYYQLVVTNTCTPNTLTSNLVFVQVINNVGFTFNLSNVPTGYICPGTAFTPNISSAHVSDSAVKFSWSANPAYISPPNGGPIGNTGGAYFFGLFRNSTASFPFIAQNNTNARVTTQISITPSVYDYPGPPTGAFNCSIAPQVIDINIWPMPVASATVPNATICSGTSADIAVTGNITDAPMTFNWTRNNSPTVTGATSGTSPVIPVGGTFPINNVLTNTTMTAQNVVYTITPVSNGCSGAAITITITVAPLLNAGVVAANQTICNGDNPVAFTETTPANGISPSYQWQSSTVSATGPWTNISGATATTYDAPAGLTQSTWYIRVVTSTVNGVTCSVANTSPILVTINNITPGSVAGNQTICNGGDPSAFTVTTAASATGAISYQWEYNTTGCSGIWSNITVNGTSSTYDPPAGLLVTTYYRRRATSTLSGNPCADFSNCITVTVNNVTGGTVGNDQVLCGNNPAAFTEITAATGAGILTYIWQSSTTGCGGPWSTISGATSSTYDAPSGLTVTTYYHRITTSTLNSISCTASSNCITVTANTVTGGTINGNRTVCIGGDPAAFTVSVLSTGTNITYQWQSSLSGGIGTWTDISGATGAVYDVPGPVTQVMYYQRITISNISSVICTAASNPVTVFVNDITASTVAGDQAVCSNDPAAFTVVSPATGLGTITYQWQRSTTGCSGPWTNITAANGTTYDPPILTVTTYYHVIATSTINSVACNAISNCITVICNARTWNGSISTDWNNPVNWTPNGVPTAASCVLVPNTTIKPYIQGSNYDAYAYSLTILNGGTVEIIPTNSLTVTDIVNVNPGGSFNIKNNSSLVQVNNVANIGNINMERTTQPMYRYDYTYWNSPLTLASGYTLGNLSPNTQPDKYYSWNPTNSGGNGNWVQESVATQMNPAKGYIIRGPNSFSINPTMTQAYTANFIGIPNNGDISVPIVIGTLPSTVYNDKLNLIGNPYPSAVNADAFLNDDDNDGLVDGTIYFWTHHSPPSAAYSNPFYGTFTNNYTAGDYATYNTLGAVNSVPQGYGGPIPNGFIAAGQSFFIKGTASGNAIFKNSMRDKSNNGAFFRMASDFEKHRVWLNLANAQGGFSQTLVGYAEGATNNFDRGFDGSAFSGNFVSFYSILPDNNLTIQGRSLPFDENDQVELGYNATAPNTYSIGIDHVDGIFETHAVYLEDKLLNIIHDIKVSPYTFMSAAGTFNTRFVLRYTNATLGLGNPDATTQNLIGFINNRKLTIQASQNIVSIKIFDISGKLISTYSPETENNLFDTEFYFAEGIYFAKTKLVSGVTVTSKLLNKN